MMKNVEQFYEDAIEKWRINEGIGTMMLNKNTDYKPIVLGIIQRIFNKSPSTWVTIVVKDFIERTNLIQNLTTTEDTENNEEIKDLINRKRIRILTSDFLNNHFVTKVDLCIIIDGNSINNGTLNYMSECRFKLSILFEYLQNTDYRLRLYKHCPILKSFTQQEVQQLRLTHPVEEMLISVDIDDKETIETIEKCDKFINQTFNIFGSFDNALKARMGDKSLNISAIQICKRIAEENGWNDSLDMNIPINVAIDEMYNPNALYERASQVSSIIKERAKILSDYNGKLDKIKEIVEEHIDSKIIIINKRGEFANKVTDYLNNTVDKLGLVCGNCHDKAEPVIAYDDYGKPIRYKSGANAGEIKQIKAQAQYTQNLKLFNNDKLNVLSFSNSPDKNTTCNIDVLIITSPSCDTVEEYIYKLANINFSSNPLKVYTIFCKNTIEEKRLESRQPSETHQIVNKSEIVTDFDKNIGICFVE